MKTNAENITSLNGEMNDLADSLNLPDEVVEIISRSIIQGQQGEVRGLNIGDKAPDFTLNDVNGNRINLNQLLEKGPVILSFFRGSWCPFCNIELQALQRHYPEFYKLGAELVTIHPQKIEVSSDLIDKYRLKFPVLSDENQEVISSFNIRFTVSPEICKLYKESFEIDLEQLNGNGLWNLPVPATFIIDSDGIIKTRHFSHNHMIRMEPRDIIEALSNLPEITPEKNYVRNS